MQDLDRAATRMVRPTILVMRFLTGRRAHAQRWAMTAVAITASAIFVSCFVIIGADSYWLVALGDHIRESGSIPDGVPFASADTSGWHNVVVLAELVFSGLHSAGSWPLPYAQVLADVLALALISLSSRRAGASDGATAGVLILVVLGSLPSLVVVRVQLFSLVMFAILLLVLRKDEAQPSHRIWAVPALIALWSNLHGAALTGVVVAGCYLLFYRLRLRPLETLALGGMTLVAPLATPVGFRTLAYYSGVLDNEAAARGTELWARPSLSSPFDVLMLICATALLCLALRRRRRVWEYVALGGLACGSLMAARHGVWFLMLAAVPAAQGLTPALPAVDPIYWKSMGDGRRCARVAALAALLSAPAVAARADHTVPADPRLVAAVAAVASDRVVLAPEPLVESLAVAGVRVWVCDPIDAFSRVDQRAYLDFLRGHGPGAASALEGAEVVVVRAGSVQADVVRGSDAFEVADVSHHGWVIYERTGS